MAGVRSNGRRTAAFAVRRPNFLLYHTPEILSSIFSKKFAQNLSLNHPIFCATFCIDFSLVMWYTIYRVKGEPKRQPPPLQKKLKKTLDKLKKMCYNKYRR